MSKQRVTKSNINMLLKKSRDAGTVNRLAGSGRPRIAELVNDLVELTE